MHRRDFLQLSALGLLTACAREASAPPAQPAAAPLRVEVWHDLICPWCRIGLHNLERVVTTWNGPPVQVILHPYLLQPDTPVEGTDLRAHLAAKYGATRPDQMFTRVTQAGAQYGVTFNWDAVRVSPATVAGHALLDFAGARQRETVHALHQAYFMEGQNLGAVDVLAAVARNAGLDVDAAVQAALDPDRQRDIRRRAGEAAARRISGVPHFKLGSRTLHGARPPEDLRAALQAMA